MVDYELDSLYVDGVDGVKVKVFTTSLDSPGRSELMGMFVCLLCFFFFVNVMYFCLDDGI